MLMWNTEKNAENRRHGGAGLIDESVMENKLTSSIIDAAIEVHRLGIVLNFGQPLLRDGISRVVNNFQPPLRPRASLSPR